MKELIYKLVICRYYHILFGTNNHAKRLELCDKNCLCIGPHPDDESIGCGGTLARYPGNFDVVCCTDGSRSFTTMTKDELIAARAKEFETAMKIAGVRSARMLGLPDKALLINSSDVILDISNYDCIFVPNLLDQHRDHRSVSVFLNHLLSKQKYKKDLKIFMYEVWSALALPNYRVNITETKQKKLDMINAHASQVSDFPYEKILDLNSYRGMQTGQEYAEAFMGLEVKTFKKLLKIYNLI